MCVVCVHVCSGQVSVILCRDPFTQALAEPEARLPAERSSDPPVSAALALGVQDPLQPCQAFKWEVGI